MEQEIYSVNVGGVHIEATQDMRIKLVVIGDVVNLTVPATAGNFAALLELKSGFYRVADRDAYCIGVYWRNIDEIAF